MDYKPDTIEPGRNRRLPSLDNILNASAPGTTEPAATVNAGPFPSSQGPAPPSSPPIGPGFASSKCHFDLGIFHGRNTSPSPSKQPPYANTPAPSSAGDKFRTWFPGVVVERDRSSSPSDPRAYSTKPAGVTAEPLRPLSPPGAQIGVSEPEQPRRVSLPSISSIAGALGEGLGNQHEPYRRSSASEESYSNRHVAPVAWGHSTSAIAQASEVRMTLSSLAGLVPTSPEPPTGLNVVSMANLLGFGGPGGAPAASTEGSQIRVAKDGKRGSADGPGDDGDRPRAKKYKCTVKGCNKSYGWKENLTRHKSTVHAPMLNRCPFCKANGLRASFNRLDNFKEHIRRHMREDGGGGGSGRFRTEYHPLAKAYCVGVTPRAKRRRQEKAAARKGGRVAGPEGAATLGSAWGETSEGLSYVLSVVSLAD